MDDTALGGLLRRHREAAGLTQEELAERAGVSARTISDVERGLRDGVYRETAARIAMGLGLAGDERALFEASAQRPRRPGRQAAIGLQPAAAPTPPTRLVGREQELAAILASLRDPRVRLVSLPELVASGRPGWRSRRRQRLASTFRMGCVSYRWRRPGTPAWWRRLSPAHSA